MLFLCGALLAAAAGAQEPEAPRHRDTLQGWEGRNGWSDWPELDWSGREFRLPDSLAHLAPWQPDYRAMSPRRPNPAVTMTSVLLLDKRRLPRRIVVLNNNAVQFGHHVVISNGQAWTNGSYLDAFLDARTLSFPMPR